MCRMTRPTLVSFALCLVSLICAACAGRLPPIGVSEQPFRLASDEARLWERALREHHKLSNSSALFHDPLLEDYLTTLARRLLPPGVVDHGIVPSVHVLHNPSLNAFAYPAGSIYLHSGLLARLENEAQVATVLAHELGHIVHRHAIRHLREERDKDLWQRVALVTTPLVLSPLLAPLGVTVGGGVNPAVLWQRPSVEDLLTEEALDSSLDLATRRDSAGRIDPMTAWYTRTRPPLALVTSVRGYHDSLEKEADRFAVEALGRIGYDPQEAERTLARLHGIAIAQAAQEAFWWGRPSVYEARRQWVKAAIVSTPSATATAGPPQAPGDVYQQRSRRLVRENAMAELKAGRTDEAIGQLDRVLRLHPQDARGHYYLGQAYAAKAANTGELRKAIEAYTNATQIAAGFADAYRALALLYARLGESERAAEAREAYVTLRGGMADFGLSSVHALGNRDLEYPSPSSNDRPRR